MHNPVQGDIIQVYSIKTLLTGVFSFALGLIASIEVKLVDGFISELFESRTLKLVCISNTINQILIVWYHDAATRNLILTLKSSDTDLYKCGINGMNSTTSFTTTV